MVSKFKKIPPNTLKDSRKKSIITIILLHGKAPTVSFLNSYLFSCLSTFNISLLNIIDSIKSSWANFFPLIIK